MSENPDAIRADIEETRRRLGSNVDAVADKVTPSHIVQRQTDKMKDAVSGVKDRVMGAADSMTDKVQSGTGSASDGVSRVGSAVGEAPQKLTAKAQGNPIAAGLIAFGAGLLAASLIPASEKERVAADNIKTAAEPLTTQVTDTAKEMAQGLKEPAQEAMENVKATATEAAQNVKQEGQGAAGDVKSKATDAQDNVRNA
jgi:gas vesicle protein